jgi:uncharacterized protein (TIGR02594 family)
MTTNQRLYQHARKDLGLSEIAGSRSNPRIKLAIETAAKWLDGDDSKTAWCGCIMGLWCLELGLGVPAAYYRAVSWLNWGHEVDLKDVQMGDVVVLKRPGGNHVSLFEASSVKHQGHWDLFGGNQSNTVNSSPYATSQVLGVRRAA